MAKLVTIQHNQPASRRNAKTNTAPSDGTFSAAWKMPCAGVAVLVALVCLGGAVRHASSVGGDHELSPTQARTQMGHKLDNMKAPRSGFANVASGMAPGQGNATQ